MSKKAYSAPAVRFESMNISSHIASGCASGPTFEEFACPVMVPEWGITFFGLSNCDYYPPNPDDMICYHVPTADNNIFTS